MKTRKLSCSPIVIMFTNNKGGCGKTSECIELAYLLGEKYKVLAIDMDPQCNLSLYSNVDLTEHKNLKDVLDVEFEDVKECIQSTDNYDVIAGSRQLVNAAKLYPDSDDEYILQELISELDYDFILLDSAPAQSLLSKMEYTAADYVIGVTECDDGSLIGIRNIKEDIKATTKRRNPKLKYLGIILNKYDNTTINKLASEELDEMAKEIGCKPFETKIRKSSKSSEAKTARQSVSQYDKRNNIAIDNKNLLKEILKRIKEDGRLS
ncbi:MAG: ParA family protein [Lachnospiraceae bacterium]|nr:ParA family protein [Lachnospiraceae bacterium]